MAGRAKALDSLLGKSGEDGPQGFFMIGKSLLAISQSVGAGPAQPKPARGPANLLRCAGKNALFFPAPHPIGGKLQRGGSRVETGSVPSIKPAPSASWLL